ncbi:3-hydroxyacyl-ACP dehydratase [Terrimonas sp.]|uniref:3-hydroxyacyl-ACP dehydratase n=1 Tax=Terrimonas sp. TaxID=1914338 RepID=UPI001F0BE8BC|nr:3-hydroxyacyl-ACP dehydratase [Terrimonas sp.]
MSDILSFIPQRPPFVMVSEIIKADAQACTTKFLVDADNIFMNNGFLGEPALVENIAQTAAAHTGYLCSKKNEPVPVGFIGAVQQLEVFALPSVNDILETEITVKNQVLNVALISGKITCRQKPVAQCEMKIFIQPDK